MNGGRVTRSQCDRAADLQRDGETKRRRGGGYDVLGREVAALVNKIEQPGSYVVQFRGNDLPSGVYFCRLTAGSYRDIRKMLLLK